MAKPLYALFTHGVGTQKPGFSSDAQKHLAAGLAGQGRVLYGSEALWAPVLDREEAAMLASVGKRGSSNRPMQRLVVETLADALCWENRREPIFDVLDMAYCRLRAPGKVTLVGHSLGCLVLAEWVRSRGVAVESFVTTGCNIGLFALGGKFVLPPALIGVPWLNAFDPQDFLGYPVAHVIPGARDVEVNVGGWFTSWNFASHLGYWSEKSLWRQVVPAALV